MASPLSLLHVPVSHFSEKARWALDYKQVPHTRRWPPGGLHPLVSFVLTRGRHQTVPVLVMDGEGIGDSTEIIRRLEERFPEPRLYPAEPEQRRRALDLEEIFDEQLGPQIRRMAYHYLVDDPELLAELALHQVQYGHRATLGFNKRVLKLFLHARFGVASREGALAAERGVVDALDRLDRELGEREYLVGERFSVADLTAAALLYPLVLPPQTPWQPSRLPQRWAEFREAQLERPGCRFALEMYRRHRAPGAAPEASAAPPETLRA